MDIEKSITLMEITKFTYGFLSEKCGRESLTGSPKEQIILEMPSKMMNFSGKRTVFRQNLWKAFKAPKGQFYKSRGNSQVIDREVWQLIVVILLFILQKKFFVPFLIII